MKRNTLIKIFTTILAAGLLATFLPPVSALGASINVNPNKGPVGADITVTGSGFTPSQGYNLFFSDTLVTGSNISVEDNLSKYRLLAGLQADQDGNLSRQVTIPTFLNVSGSPVEYLSRDGTYHIYLAYFNTMANKNFILASTEFRVTGFATTELDFEQGFVGEELEITGEGFLPGENIQVRLVDTDVDNVGIDITADFVDGSRVVTSSGTNAGKFRIVIPVPDAGNGPKTIRVIGMTSGTQVDLEFTVLAKITLSPTQGEAGSQILVTGTGFARRNFVRVYIGETLILTTTERTSSGRFVVPVTIPADKTPGTYQIRAVDANNTSINASANFTVLLLLNPAINLEPLGEKVGDTVELSGTEFNNNKSITLTIDGTAITPDSAITTTGTGIFTGSFSIPEMPAGTYTLKASDGTVEAADTFTVVSDMTMSPSSGKAGTPVTVTGTGYRANANITIRFAGTAVAFDTTPRTDSKGSFSFTFNVPAVAPGAHVVEVAIGTATVTRSFTTAYDFNITPLSGKTGTQVVITGDGFAANQTVNITFGGIQLPVSTTNAQGVLNHQFTVPHIADGDHTVEVRIGTVTETRSFTTQAQVTFSSSNGPVGTEVTVSGTGFGPNKPLTLTFGTQTITLTSGSNTDAQGNVNTSFKVPAKAAGSYTISISDGTITKTSSFAVSASTPPTPQLVAPAMGAKLDGPVTFDWQPVDYTVMDITYELQVSRSPNFATLVLDKKGLTETEYITLQTEQLEKATAEEPYYWRVRVVDEAGNTSAWSGAAQFAYGSSWPVWLTWVLISLGVIVLGILAFWLGRRIAYYSY